MSILSTADARVFELDNKLPSERLDPCEFSGTTTNFSESIFTSHEVAIWQYVIPQ